MTLFFKNKFYNFTLFISISITTCKFSDKIVLYYDTICFFDHLYFIDINSIQLAWQYWQFLDLTFLISKYCYCTLLYFFHYLDSDVINIVEFQYIEWLNWKKKWLISNIIFSRNFWTLYGKFWWYHLMFYLNIFL